MKHILKNIIILVAGLLVLSLIIYLGQMVTNLRLRNNNWLKSIENNNQISFNDLNKLLPELELTSKQINILRQKWLELIVLIPKLRNDVELQQQLVNLGPALHDIQNGILISNIIKGQDEALKPLIDLNNIFIFLEKYNIEAIKNLKYETSNWLSFLGNTSPKNYLLLFQEPDISRPSGGFLGDYGLLVFNQGKATISGDTIFDLDDLLINKIIPPEPLQQISNKWFFHDLNWFFDFPTTAKKIMEFYGATGLSSKIDGVIALNDSVIESILNITGPIELPDYGQTITADNFVAFFDQQIMKSTQATDQEREIFSDFMSGLFLKLQNLSSAKFQELQNILVMSLNNKDIQLFSNDDQIEYFLDSLNWAGKITESHQDYLAVVFNNLDKNLQIDKRIKSIDLETQISTSTITNTLTIRAPALGRSDLNRETYLKIYLPKGVTITKATGSYLKSINNDWPYDKLGYQFDRDIQNIESRQIVDSSNSITIFEETSKTVIGAWTKLSAQSFTLSYELPFSPTNLTNWNIIVQKQSGQDIKFLYNLKMPFEKKLAPTLFEFNKYIPLTQDLNLSFNFE
jgi:hypothetical protein